MKIHKIFTHLAQTKPVEKFFEWSNTKSGTNFLNNSLPTLETLVATSCYTVATEKQDLDRRRKNLLHIQNWVPAIVGMGVGSYLNRRVSRLGDEVCKHLDPNMAHKVHKVDSAIRVMLPIFTTMTLMRLVLPTAVAWFSGEAVEKAHKKEEKQVSDLTTGNKKPLDPTHTKLPTQSSPHIQVSPNTKIVGEHLDKLI